MKNYIKPELDLISIFAEENIASGASLLGNDEDVADGSSVYIKDNPWDLWDWYFSPDSLITELLGADKRPHRVF